MDLEVKIINRSANPLPAYQTDHSAGMDLMAFIQEPIIIKPMQRCLIPTGIFIELPQGQEAQVRPRSGLALKHGITVLNSPGTVDSDYRGEVKVLLINLSDIDFEVKNGDRIAQMIISRHEKIKWVATEELADTTRGAGGYGSTGK
jgi:dUTP pyrophosphatase